MNTQNIIKPIFQFFTYVLHPLFMPLLGMVIILTNTHLALLPSEGKIAIFKIVGMSTLLLPLLVLPILYYQKLITKITISDRNERLIPIFIILIFYFFGYYILNKLNAPGVIQYFALATFCCLLLAGLISFKWKISLHMIGVGGIIGLISSIGFLFQISIDFILMVGILMAGIVGSSRLYLKEHNHIQIYSGFMLGFILTFGIIVAMNVI